MSNVTNEQLIFLDNLIYLDFSKVFEKYKVDERKLFLGDLISELIENIEDLVPIGPEGRPACMSREEWVNLLTAFSNNENNREFLDEYIVKEENYENHSAAEGGFRACCFEKLNNEGKADDTIVIFRGTSTNETEWTDNVLNANKVWSDPMDDAVLYIDGLSSEEYGDNITVIGHSKGGNRAQYVTILRKD